jgi:hypothetical protein
MIPSLLLYPEQKICDDERNYAVAFQSVSAPDFEAGLRGRPRRILDFS